MRDEKHRGLPKRSEHAEPNPMDEENFPDNPTRRAADREMDEATNVPGSMPERRKRPAVRETDEEA